MQIKSNSTSSDNNRPTTFSVSSIEEENYSVSTNHDSQNVEVYDLSDLSTWPNVLTHIMKYEIVKLGPMQIKNCDFPPNEGYPKRRFSVYYYYRKLPNNEVVDRQWLVYSMTKYYVNCFACKLFSEEIINDNNYDCRLANNGFND
jgi:hypothetical protein